MKPDIRTMQKLLSEAGFDPKGVDGILGPNTLSAWREFKWYVGRPRTDDMDIRSICALKNFDKSQTRDLPWMEEGKTVYGLHETRDKARLSAWLISDGKTLGDPSALPWCGDWSETIFKNTLPEEPFPGELGKNPYWARNWLEFGREVKPTFGAVAVFARGSGGHVSNFVGESASDYFVLGGNQSNMVNITRIAKSRLLGARWPSTYPYRYVELPKMSNDTMPRSTNEF
jgi:uncharacterized protein (TIGR02594 family)